MQVLSLSIFQLDCTSIFDANKQIRDILLERKKLESRYNICLEV